MTEKYKILGRYIKDLSSETPDAETYIFVKDRISKYQLGIDINSKALKNNMIEVNTTFKFGDPDKNNKKSYFEIVFSTIIKINDDLSKDSLDFLNQSISYIIFLPEMERLFQTSPSYRRNFLDRLVFARRNDYNRLINKYKKLIIERIKIKIPSKIWFFLGRPFINLFSVK